MDGGVILVLPPTVLLKVSHCQEVNNNGSSCVVSSNKVLQQFCCILFVPKVNIRISLHVASKTVARKMFDILISTIIHPKIYLFNIGVNKLFWKVGFLMG